MALSNTPLDGFSKQFPQQCRLPEDQEQINRRNFLKAAAGISLGTAAISSLFKESHNEKMTANAQAPFFYKGKDGNGIPYFGHPSGKQEISMMFTNHNEIVDPLLFPDDVTDFSYDNGGQGRITEPSHSGFFFDASAPLHYKKMGEHLINKDCNLHLLCPAAPFSNNEDTTIPKGIDYGIAATQCGIGSLVMKDAVRELCADLKHSQIDALRQSSIDNLITWDILKGGTGAMLMEPLFAAISRLPNLGTLDEASKAWLQSAFTRNSQLLSCMNQYIDLLHVIKLRQLMADKMLNHPQKKQHFQLVIGRTHVGVASNLERSMDDLFAELENPMMRIMLLLADPPHSMSVLTSAYSRFKKQSDSSDQGFLPQEEKWRIFYPEIFKRLPQKQQEEFVHFYPTSYLLSHRAIGTPEGQSADINLFAGRS